MAARVNMSEKEAIERGIIPPASPARPNLAATTAHPFDGEPVKYTPTGNKQLPSHPRPAPNADATTQIVSIANGGAGRIGWWRQLMEARVRPMTLGKAILALLSWLVGFAMGLRWSQ